MLSSMNMRASEISKRAAPKVETVTFRITEETKRIMEQLGIGPQWFRSALTRKIWAEKRKRPLAT